MKEGRGDAQGLSSALPTSVSQVVTAFPTMAPPLNLVTQGLSQQQIPDGLEEWCASCTTGPGLLPLGSLLFHGLLGKTYFRFVLLALSLSSLFYGGEGEHYRNCLWASSVFHLPAAKQKLRKLGSHDTNLMIH